MNFRSRTTRHAKITRFWLRLKNDANNIFSDSILKTENIEKNSTLSKKKLSQEMITSHEKQSNTKYIVNFGSRRTRHGIATRLYCWLTKYNKNSFMHSILKLDNIEKKYQVNNP